VVDRGNGILPDQRLGGDFWAQIAGARTHVAMGEFESGAGEGVGNLVGMFQEMPADRLVDWIDAKRQIGGQHGRPALLRGIERVRDQSAGSLRDPLMRAGRTLRQLPFIAEQVTQEVDAPTRRRGGSDDFKSAADGAGTCA
jgi:hypothetical protein